jgi:S-DNA-T family DNA segregation ATPase FtsK/SpoIIIE
VNVHLVWQTADGEQDLEVGFPPGATVGLLLDALTGESDLDTAFVDGLTVPAGRLVEASGLCDGSVVRLDTPDPQPSPASRVVEVRVVAGSWAGGRWLLEAGRYRLGSDSNCEIRLPAFGIDPHHAVIEVGQAGEGFIEPVGNSPVSVNGRAVLGRTNLRAGSLVRVGRSMWEFSPLDQTVMQPGIVPEGGAFNRPPRTQQSPVRIEVDVPERPADPAVQRRPGWAALLVPLVMGGLFAVLFSPMMAAFALLGPMMMLANWVEDRWRVRKERCARAGEFAADLRRFGHDLSAAAASEISSLRAGLPDAPEVVARALAASPRLWERRPGHRDFLGISLGMATVAWTPPLSGAVDDREAAAVVSHGGVLEDVPLGIELTSGTILGIAGRRNDALALARWVAIQVSVHQGPADARIAIISEHPEDWDWAKWLPHTAAGPATGRRLLAAHPDDIDEVVAHLGRRGPSEGPGAPLTVLIVDAETIDPVRRSRLRSIQAGAGVPVAGVVISSTPTSLPGLCSIVVEIPETDEAARCRFPAVDRVVDDLLLIGLPVDIALACSRALARHTDPEIWEETTQLPDLVALAGLFGSDPFTVETVLNRWDLAGPVPQPVGPIGVTAQGPLMIDLAGDGPHGLIAGTTGSGKSELLRSLIVSLAASVDPDHLTFALIDYKGGSAFDACVRLPHVVGVVTDLDAHLGRRALICLEAELRYREARFRAAGAADLPEYLLTMPTEPLPRLAVVIDEFAALASELPGFVPSLVDIAQRGRSLGVHLLLATQRPAGVIGENIRANTNLRVALRVQDTADSRDVLDDHAAAAIPRGRAGRGYLRLGPGELIAFQAALVSMKSTPGEAVPIEMRPFSFGWEPHEPIRDQSPREAGPTDLDRLVDVIAAAARRTDVAVPRALWPPDLPRHLPFEAVVTAPGKMGPWWAPLGLMDEPQRQRQSVWGWEAQNLLLYGMPGSGPSSALLTLGCSLAARYQPDRLHIYGLDFGTRTLAPLEALPQVGNVIGSADRERQVRLLRHLQDEIAIRRADGPGDRPVVLLLLDNYGGFAAAFDQPADLAYRDALRRIVADGPGVGVFVVVSADQAAAVPTGLAALIPEKLVFRMADLFDYAALGLPNRELPDLPAGRAVQVGTGLVVQIAQVSSSVLGTIAARSVHRGATPIRIGMLPDRSTLADVVGSAAVQGREWFLPIGIGDQRLEPVGWRLGESDHALVAGPSKSGKSTVLLSISGIVANLRPDVTITAVAPRRSPLWDAQEVDTLVTAPEELETAVGRILDDASPHLILVDDADDLTDPGGALLRLIRQRRPNIRVVGAGRADALRSMYGHWTQELRRSRQGIALRPQVEVDGELWHTPLPRHGPPGLPPGRGYLISDGGVELIQVAHP